MKLLNGTRIKRPVTIHCKCSEQVPKRGSVVLKLCKKRETQHPGVSLWHPEKRSLMVARLRANYSFTGRRMILQGYTDRWLLKPTIIPT